MAEQTLLPCPFCGGEAVMEEVEKGLNARFSVGCAADEPDCMGYQSLTTFDRRGEAASAWNKRPSLEAAAPDLSDFASHTQWEVIMGALEKWTKDGGSQLVALGIIGHGLLILDEARRAALARATTKDNPHERGSP